MQSSREAGGFQTPNLNYSLFILSGKRYADSELRRMRVREWYSWVRISWMLLISAVLQFDWH